jgi:hypothetical protein
VNCLSGSPVARSLMVLNETESFMSELVFCLTFWESSSLIVPMLVEFLVL